MGNFIQLPVCRSIFEGRNLGHMESGGVWWVSLEQTKQIVKVLGDSALWLKRSGGSARHRGDVDSRK